jgi:hypothetical protein
VNPKEKTVNKPEEGSRKFYNKTMKIYPLILFINKYSSDALCNSEEECIGNL